MNLSPSEIAEAVQANSHSARNGTVPSGYSIDSRTLQAGECFIAICGKNFDGHQFIPEAFSRGASLVIVQSGTTVVAEPNLPVIWVENTLAALQRLASYAREKWGKKVVAITGSTGKTTTKEITAHLLGSSYRVFKSTGNFNNDYGLPLSILKIREQDEVAVLELGMSAAGEIARLTKIARPDVGIVTNVRPVHLEFFQSVDGIARAKRELIDNLSNHALAILNNDDTRVRKFSRYFSGQVLTYGIRTTASYRVSGVRFKGLSGCQLRLSHREIGRSFDIPLIGVHNVYNCLPGIVLAHQLGLGFEAIAQRLQQLRPLPGRGEVLHFEEGFSVVNDSYNSNPAALETMISFLKRVPGYKRKILVAGEMLELGPRSQEYHRDCGSSAARSKLDVIVGVRGQAQFLINESRARGYDDSRALFFESVDEAGEWLSGSVKARELILVKGSRGVKTELMIETLKRHHSLIAK
jgi:UDP-N-acetylmuramoyl-tripeptide--D-alanyl-D-alanine ligase